MAGNLKEVRNRIKSVANTQQITKAMKMVSAAKLRRATERIVQMRPYSNKLNEILSNIVAGGASDINSELVKEREAKKIIIVVVTSDRGLCGGFNSNIIKLAKKTIAENYAEQNKLGNVQIMAIGKKANDAFKRSGNINADFTTMFSNLTFENSANVSQYLMNAYMNKEVDVIEIIYGQFKNAATQFFTREAFLPVAKPTGNASSKKTIDVVYEPGKEEIVEYLIPKILKTQFFKVLLDSNASEHGARMTAMDKASDNANEIMKELKISYNRARQAAITTELTEIVSGAAALSEG